MGLASACCDPCPCKPAPQGWLAAVVYLVCVCVSVLEEAALRCAAAAPLLGPLGRRAACDGSRGWAMMMGDDG